MSLAGCQINPIDVNFHLQKSLKIVDKNSADKIWSKKDKEWKKPCLMPIRIKGWHNLRRYFQFDPTLKKGRNNNQIHQLFKLNWNKWGQWFRSIFLRMGPNWKVTSEIKVPLKRKAPAQDKSCLRKYRAIGTWGAGGRQIVSHLPPPPPPKKKEGDLRYSSFPFI